MGEFITVAEAGRRMGVERQTAYKYARDGRLPTQTIAGRLVVDADDLASVTVKPPGGIGPDGHTPREWTRAMTLRRIDEWNGALERGEFDNRDGSISAKKMAAFEKKVGYTHAELLDAAQRLERE